VRQLVKSTPSQQLHSLIETGIMRVQRDPAPRSSVQEARESAERDHILRVLEETNWNVSGAARALGMERTNLHKRIRALGLSRGSSARQAP